MVTDTILAKACLESYKEKIMPNLEGFECDIITKGNDRCLIFYNEKDVVVVFTGSNDLEDWWTNVQFIKQETLYGKIHNGFWEAWLDLRSLTRTALERVNAKDKNIYVTGHSLGGALACLFSVDSFYSAWIKRLVTFGQPRVGNWTWKGKFKTLMGPRECVRYINNQDTVTKIPSFFFFHVGRPVYFDKHGRKTIKKPWSWKFIIRKIKGINDHSMRTYFQLLDDHRL